MKFILPEKTNHSIPSLIREVAVRGASIPGFISLAIGNPAAEAIPSQELKQSIEALLAGDLLTYFEYGPSAGDTTFKELTKQRLVEKKQFPKEHQAVTVLNGSTHGSGLVPRTICNEGDEIYFEDFSFTGAIRAAHATGCIPIGIATDDQGMLPDELAKTAQSGKGKLIYLNPNFHNPTGTTMPLSRRKEIYAVAQQYNLFIYEDDPYGDIRFHGKHLPCFKAMDPDDRVIFAGSYSKTIAPGLRMGYLYANERLIKAFDTAKSSMDGESPLLTQRTIVQTLQTIDYEAHIQDICKLYGKRCRLLLDTLQQYAAPSVQFTQPEGGMFVWATLPEDVPMDDFYEDLFAHGVGAVRSEAFAVDPVHRPGHSFRLNFTYPSLVQLEEGAKRFSQVTRLYCQPLSISAH